MEMFQGLPSFTYHSNYVYGQGPRYVEVVVLHIEGYGGQFVHVWTLKLSPVAEGVTVAACYPACLTRTTISPGY